jgi:hypothetical protein
MSGRESKRKRKIRLALVAALAVAVAPGVFADAAGAGQSYIPGRVGVRGTVPNPGTQQQELSNITLPAPYNVFEFTVTCAGCHGGSIDQQVAHFGVQAGTAMASSARDPVFRANQIAVNNILRAVSGEDGAGNMCFRCHSPNGWYSGRFDPTLGGDAEGRTMMHSIVASTDDEGISCEQCHRAIGQVQYQKTGLDPKAKVWNLMKGIGGYPADPGWPHDGKGFVDQAGTPTVHADAPFGDTSLQYADGMTYAGPYSGTVYPYFSDSPWLTWGATDYTGQIYGVYPPGDPREGQPVVNADGSIAASYDLPISAPIDFTRSNFTTNPPRIVYDYQKQSMSLEHPTAGNGFITRSEFCGSCHELTVPVLNHGMPEQRTYTEWKFSAYSRPNAGATLGIPVATERTQAGEVRCQDCHMPKLRHEYADNAPAAPNADPVLTGWFPYAKDRNVTGGTSKHTHAGANRDLGQMMKLLYPEPDQEVVGVQTGPDVRVFPGMLSTRDPTYDRNVRNAELSMADAVAVQILSGPVETATAGVYEVQVKVTNRTGHRIPTGYPDGRRMWVALDVKDAATGASVYRSGVYDLADARLYTDAGAKALNRALAPLIDAVNGANAVMVYERVTCRDGLVPGAPLNDGLPDGICEDSGTPFLPNNRIMFDNRIPPAGFTYADYRNGGVKFWNYTLVANPNAGGALRPQPCEDAPGYTVDPTAVPSTFGGSCAAATAQRYADGQGFDVVTYRFAAPTGSTLSARADIEWQTHTREYMTQLRDQQELLGLADTVRPVGPVNASMPGYPTTPSYLSDVIGLANIADPYNPGVPLRDNWGGVAYAAWLQTGRGAPAVVAVADTSVTAPPAAPAAPTAVSTPGIPFEATLSWAPVAGAEGYVVSILYGCPKRPLVKGAVDGTRCYDPALDGTSFVETVGSTTQWDRLAIVPPSSCTATECTLVNTAMNVKKTYGLKVSAFNAAGFGPDSPVTTFQTPWDLPLPPDLLKLLSVTTGSATLTWTDTADNETIFVVQLVPVTARTPPLSATLTPTAGGTSVIPPPAPEVVHVFATQTPGLNGFGGNTDTVTGLAPGTSYNVQVQACNATACSGMNANGPIQIKTAIQLLPPALNTPTVSVNPVGISLGWAVSLGATSYVVERSTDAGQTWTAFPPVTGTTYTDAAVTAASTYAYRVTAWAGTVSSAPSNVQTVTTPVGLATPGTPAVSPTAITNGTTAGASARTVTVTWTYTNQGQTGFRVFRTDANTGAVTPLTVTTAAASVTNCRFAGAAAAARSCTTVLPQVPASQGKADLYDFMVSALQGTTESLQSAPSPLVTLTPSKPAAPTSLTLVASGAGAFQLGWQDNAQNELGFVVERQLRERANLATCTGAWSAYTTSHLAQQPAVAGAGAVTSAPDGGLHSGACYEYRYRVQAVNEGLNGVNQGSAWTAYSTPASAP